jgi:hypothetical protein
MEIFLKEWFREDPRTQSDISRGAARIQLLENHAFKGWINPKHWESVIENNATINVILPSAMNNPPTPPSPITDETSETQYEESVQYAVHYFRKNEKHDASPMFVSRSTYTEPVEFEVTSSDDKLPALEETKDVISPHTNLAGPRGLSKGGKKATLGRLDTIGETALMIHSPYLMNILKSVVEYSAMGPEGAAQGLNTGLYISPFQDLYYHLPDLEEYKSDNSPLRQKHSAEFNEKCDKHIDLLAAYLESQPDLSIVEAKSHWNSKIPVTTFAAFWLLLKPGTDVYVQEPDGSLNAFVVHKVAGGIETENGKRKIRPYIVSAWNLVFGGRAIFRRMRTIHVPVFDSVREIVELPVFPVKYVDTEDNDETKEKLVSRGKRYFKYSKGPSFLQYTGQGSKKGMKTVSTCAMLTEFAK